MDQLQQQILEIFNDFKTPVNGILKPQSIYGQIRTWDKRSQDNANQALNNLISDGYVGTKDSWLILTQKGYDFLYQDYSISDTEQLILNLLNKRNLGVGNVIMDNWFTVELPKLERYHFDNFYIALQNIIDQNFIEIKSNGKFLTQKGYDAIY